MADYATGTGQRLIGVHDESECEGRGCVIHHPSDHHMKDWPTHWRGGGLFDVSCLMERICEHGVGHPDPDDAAFRASRGDSDTTHGCDGCCNPENKYSTLD